MWKYTYIDTWITKMKIVASYPDSLILVCNGTHTHTHVDIHIHRYTDE